jgi:hypothetical protein
MSATRLITELETLKKSLPEAGQDLFNRFFRVDSTVGRLVAPESMTGWITKNFGSVDRVTSQKIIKVTNLLTFEGALFNEIRACRPLEVQEGANDLKQVIAQSLDDPFCSPETGTPADTFGRVKGRYGLTASNVAKYDGYHGIVIFNAHDPLALDRAAIIDYFEVALEWGRRAAREVSGNNYFFLMWNCLWKSGASIIHGHAQMTLTKGMHYPKVEALRRIWAAYKAQYHGADYFDDLYRLHADLGLAWEWHGVHGLAYLTPVKEKEVLLITSKAGRPLYDAVGRVLERYLRQLGVTSFNLALYVPPFTATGEDWNGFPALVRLVDRGDPNCKTADVGAMELYAASVIASDPFRVAEAMRGEV